MASGKDPGIGGLFGQPVGFRRGCVGGCVRSAAGGQRGGIAQECYTWHFQFCC